jgi:hypothetical protein
MIGYDRSDDYQPLTYLGRHPMYLTTLLVITHVAAAVICCLLMGFGATGALDLLKFSSDGVLRHFHLWQPLTYAFVHVPKTADSIGPSLISFFIEMYMLLFFGQEVEKYFGRRTFLLLYVCLLLTAPLLLTLGGAILQVNLPNQFDLPKEALKGMGGSAVIHLSVFLVFATIYPNISLCLGILAKWMAWGALAAYTLGCLAFNWWGNLSVLWASAAVAYYGTRYAGVGESFSLFSSLRDRFPKRTVPNGVKPRLKPRRLLAETTSSSSGNGGGNMVDVHESIDPLLDKISKHGLASLTSSERAALERARVSLLRKERGG